MDSQRLLVYGLAAAGLIALWFLFKIVRKVVFVVLVVVVLIAFVLYLKFF